MYLADYHTHSDSSPDGKETIARLAEAALSRGLDEICVTDHVDTVYWGSNAPRWDFDWDKSLRELAEARGLRPGGAPAVPRARAGLRHRLGPHGRKKIRLF